MAIVSAFLKAFPIYEYMGKILLFFILALFPIEHYAQITLLDIHSGQPIGYASILGSDGELLSTSDANGVFHIRKGAHNISISHVAYTNMEVNLDTLRKKTIYMYAKEQVLTEVPITTERPEFVVFECYFRCPQFYNSKLEYYRDGIALYFVKLKNGRIDHQVITSRFLVDEPVYKEEMGKRGMFSYSPSIPVLDFYAIKTERDGKGKNCLVDTLPSKVRFDFDNLFPDSVKRISWGKYKQQLRKVYSSEVYKLNQDGPSYLDFLSGRWSRQMVINYKDMNKVFDQWEEIYVTEVSFARQKELKRLIKDAGDRKENIGLYLERYEIPPISEYIKERLVNMKVYRH